MYNNNKNKKKKQINGTTNYQQNLCESLNEPWPYEKAHMHSVNQY